MAHILAVPALSDLPAVYRIAVQAEPDGDPNTTMLDPDLTGHVYAGPYLVADPRACRVLVLGSSVVGFCVATTDSQAFEAWCEAAWWPGLRQRYRLPADEATHPDATLVRLIHRPDRTPDEIHREFPAHLHINLLPHAQGRGAGRALLAAVHRELAGRGIPGVHLGVSTANVRAIGFYEHLGYRHLGADGEDGQLYGLTFR